MMGPEVLFSYKHAAPIGLVEVSGGLFSYKHAAPMELVESRISFFILH